MAYRRENGRKMAYRREEWKDNGRQERSGRNADTERGVEGRWNTEERNGRKIEQGDRSGRKREYVKREWKEDDVQKGGVEG